LRSRSLVEPPRHSEPRMPPQNPDRR
jgi:hypothetical protein